jgi:hypothetical protein
VVAWPLRLLAVAFRHDCMRSRELPREPSSVLSLKRRNSIAHTSAPGARRATPTERCGLPVSDCTVTVDERTILTQWIRRRTTTHAPAVSVCIALVCAGCLTDEHGGESGTHHAPHRTRDRHSEWRRFDVAGCTSRGKGAIGNRVAEVLEQARGIGEIHADLPGRNAASAA